MTREEGMVFAEEKVVALEQRVGIDPLPHTTSPEIREVMESSCRLLLRGLEKSPGDPAGVWLTQIGARALRGVFTLIERKEEEVWPTSPASA